MSESKTRFTFIDLFAGIGGIRIPFQKLGGECLFTSEIDEECRRTYEANFGDKPFGDIRQADAADVPEHNVLLGGFPCQAFSIIGRMRGFEDTRGTLFYDIERILRAKRPRAFLLENVKMLVGHKGGETFRIILERLRALGYFVHWKVLNALDFGVPQKRERVIIVGFQDDYDFEFPDGSEMPRRSLSEILEKDVPQKYYASEHIRRRRRAAHTPRTTPSIWHENKAGHISSYPYSCALRAGASYNYLLLNGERRLTPREHLRLQGFPEDYKIVGTDHQVRKQAGNSVAVPVIEAVAKRLVACLRGEVALRSTLSQRERVPLPVFEGMEDLRAASPQISLKAQIQNGTP
ncbi:MAG: (cytosine-5)-methyltransferase 1 [Blastocatellia bacterium]|jgi:DNA (cytosine-5)-methyltransferase 1|nr:(cytosine-5)-methyltransferase 1 [Blastocatellia bacterium]